MICKRCKAEKELTDFYAHNRVCKKCKNTERVERGFTYQIKGLGFKSLTQEQKDHLTEELKTKNKRKVALENGYKVSTLYKWAKKGLI